MARFINIGFGNMVNADKVVVVVRPDAAPVKRMVQAAKENGRIIDATQGRRTKAVLMPDTIGRRIQSDDKTNLEARGDLDE